MSVTVEGMDKLVKNLSSYKAKMVQAIAEGAKLTQAQMVNHARANHAMGAHGRGRFVSRHGGSGLVGSIQPGPIEITDDTVTAEVIARAPYASFVELGTSRARAYPYLEPARRASQKPLLQNLKRFMSRVKP